MDKEDLIGRVEDNEDPAKAGRVKVSLTNMDGQTYPEWVNPIFPPGFVSVPAKEYQVVVDSPKGADAIEFAEDIRYRGQVSDEENPVPDEFKENYPKRHGFRTPQGQVIIFDDETGDIWIQSTNGSAIQIEASGKVHLDAPTTDLSDIATDPVLMGTAIINAFTALFTSWAAAASALVSSGGTPVGVVAYGTAVGNLVAAIQATLAAWPSNKVRTG